MEELIEKNFRLGFNHGYWLAKAGGQELSDLLSNQNANTSYYKGLASGKREWEKENVLQQIRAKSLGQKDRDQERDR